MKAQQIFENVYTRSVFDAAVLISTKCRKEKKKMNVNQ